MRFIVCIFCIIFCISFGFGAQSTKDKIQNTTASIKDKTNEEKKLSKKIDDIGQQIVKESKELDGTNKKIDEISAFVANLSKKHEDEEKELNDLKDQNSELLKNQNDLEDKIVELIVNDFAFDLIQDKDTLTIENILSSEIFNNLNSVLQERLKTLLQSYNSNHAAIKDKNDKIKKIETNLKTYNDKKNELAKEKKNQEKLVSNLNKNKEQYIVQLEKINKESQELRNTLENLKIIDDKEEKAKAKAREEKRQKSKKEDNDEVSEEIAVADNRVKDINKQVKQYGSSYQASRVKKYSGKKTISPLKDGYVKRKFGNYTDPVYKIKIFNESIVLGSKTKNAQVYNVLAGKVIFAKETAVLDKVIIVENGDGIHTIYAHLSQIAPTIKVGSKIKQGYSIGRVEEDLTFEVTQKNYHIDPLELISLK